MIIVTIVALATMASQGFLATLANPIPAHGEVVDIKAICQGEPITGKLNSHQVAEMSRQFGEGAHDECPQLIREAIQDLATIIENDATDICSKKSVGAIKHYYESYLAEEKDGQLPKPLVHYALSYALRMSQSCKAKMIETISGEANEHVKPEDFVQLDKWIAKGGSIDQLIGVMSGPGGFVLPSDFAALFPDFDKMMHKLAIDSAVGSDIEEIKLTCRSRFMPVYEKIVQPVASLARAGFDYPDEEIERELSVSQEQKDKIGQWARIVFLCETMNMVETYKRSIDDSSPDRALFIDREMYEQLGDRLNPTVSLDESEKNHFKTAPVIMDDFELFPDDQIEELLTALRSKKTLVETLRTNLRQKATSMVAEYLKGDKIKSMMSCLRWPRQAEAAAEPELKESKSDVSERKMCGAPKSFADMFVKIFIAGILALMMMLISAGG